MTLPPELRNRVYEYIVPSHHERSVRAVYSNTASGADYRITTSAITAICRLVHSEYEDVARKATATVEFTTVGLDFSHIITYFRHRVDDKYLANLQSNRAFIRVNMVVRDGRSCKFDMPKFYAWALFLIEIKLDAVYPGDRETWMLISEAKDRELEDLCVVEQYSTQAVRNNIEEICKVAAEFDRAMWGAYRDPELRRELQVRRRREADRRAALRLAKRRRVGA